MLTDPDGMFLTQREVPKMATVRVTVDSGELIVENGSLGRMIVPFEPDRGHRQNVIVWHSEVSGLVYNGEVSEWFSDALGKKCQLVVMPETSERHVTKEFDSGNDIVSFADGYPLLLIGEASLEELNRRIQRTADALVRNEPKGRTVSNAEAASVADDGVRVPLPMNRFRPNVVVRGSGPFEEDGWARIRIGETTFRVPKPCGRCPIPTIDQSTGEFAGKEPSRTLATFRKAHQVHPDKYEAFGQPPNAVLFGENLIPENPGGTIAIGDEVKVLEFR
jgi:uncharacterized protein YcbX